MVESNRQKYEDKIFSFIKLDLVQDQVPNVDLIFTRDCLIHLSYSNILAILRNYKNSGSKYLLVSTYTRLSRKNKNVTGVSLIGRAINLQAFFFFFSSPDALITEGCTESNNEYADKSLALFELKNINLSFF